jgi:hypothetical protein
MTRKITHEMLSAQSRRTEIARRKFLEAEQKLITMAKRKEYQEEKEKKAKR